MNIAKYVTIAITSCTTGLYGGALIERTAPEVAAAFTGDYLPRYAVTIGIGLFTNLLYDAIKRSGSARRSKTPKKPGSFQRGGYAKRAPLFPAKTTTKLTTKTK